MKPALKKLNILLLVLVASVGSFLVINSNKNKNTNEFQIATVLPARNKLEQFKLIDMNGQSFTNQQLRGKWNLLFFGYTQCPDVCPATLTLMRDTWNKFPENAPKPVNFIFVSINPQADPANKLKDFVKNFHPDFNAITGDTKTILHLQKQLGIFASNTGTFVGDKPKIEHTASLMLLNPETKLKAIISPPLDADKIIHDLKILSKS